MYDEYEKKTRRRFLKKIKRNSQSGCIEWQGGLNKNGYGQFSYRNRKSLLAHRFIAWKFGIIKQLRSKLCICHKCDNPKCVNPRHLFAGSQKDNMRDAIKKDRFCRGSQRETTHLTEKDILRIRAEYGKGMLPFRVTYQSLADEYGVGISTIQKIIKRETWRHI